MKIFICHSYEDKGAAVELAEFLKSNNFEIFIDSFINVGDNFILEINSALSSCDIFLLLWSKFAENSKFVTREWTGALNLNKVIIPCILDNNVLPAILGTIQYINFNNVKLGFERLLCRLQTLYVNSKESQTCLSF